MAKKDEKNQAVFGQASSARSEHGRLVVVHHDTEHEGLVYKAGNHDLPADVADALIADDKAFEPGGKGKGRDGDAVTVNEAAGIAEADVGVRSEEPRPIETTEGPGAQVPA